MVECKTKVRWGELDALGHVNNTVYFRWFEDVRIALFEAVGITNDRPSRLGPILATTTCDFHKPLVYPCDITLRATIPKMGNTSFGTAFLVSVDCEAVVPCASLGEGEMQGVAGLHRAFRRSREGYMGPQHPINRDENCCMDYQVLATVDGEQVVAAKGSAVVVLVDHETGNKQPIPDDLRKALGAHHPDR